MKRTDIERKEREVRRMHRHSEFLTNTKGSQNSHSVGSYIERLYNSFRYDSEEIFNTKEDIAVLEVLEDMQAHVPEKKWDDVLRKAIRKTGVSQSQKAIYDLKELMNDATP